MTHLPLPAPVRVLYVSDRPAAAEDAALMDYFGCDVRHLADPRQAAAAAGEPPHVLAARRLR
jgi:hypothetical protein